MVNLVNIFNLQDDSSQAYFLKGLFKEAVGAYCKCSSKTPVLKVISISEI